MCHTTRRKIAKSMTSHATDKADSTIRCEREAFANGYLSLELANLVQLLATGQVNTAIDTAENLYRLHTLD